MISVLCKADTHLHLALREPGLGVSSRTLCSRKWLKQEPCREGDEFCPECLEKVRNNPSLGL